jgi:hypothetical protein
MGQCCAGCAKLPNSAARNGVAHRVQLRSRSHPRTAVAAAQPGPVALRQQPENHQLTPGARRLRRSAQQGLSQAGVLVAVLRWRAPVSDQAVRRAAGCAAMIFGLRPKPPSPPPWLRRGWSTGGSLVAPEAPCTVDPAGMRPAPTGSDLRDIAPYLRVGRMRRIPANRAGTFACGRRSLTGGEIKAVKRKHASIYRFCGNDT